MEQTVTITIPASWIGEQPIDPVELRQAVQLALARLHQQRAQADSPRQVVHALLSTGRIQHLHPTLVAEEPAEYVYQTPPTLPGTPVSDIIIAQRRGEL
ncbi:MAG TPA: hypothetical protein PLJ78_08205 [Anaerolineae bacterium]|nr:hypothetical protein [Anaerolineae bacterium]HQK13907.1 hypothetical protein [Anaerolineae bacterium]